MKKTYFIIGLVIVLVLSLSVIFYGTYLNERDEIQISKRMSERAVPLVGEKAQRRNIRAKIVLDSINVYSNEMADAVALIDGRITESLVAKNSHVHKGDPIFVVVNENIPLQIKEADSNILKAMATLRQAENDYKRYIRLRQQDATSAQKYDAAEAEYNAAVANLDAMQARKEQLLVQNARQQVISPVDGKVLVIYRQQGAYVQAGTSLALVGNFANLYFATPVEDETANRMNIGQRAELIFENSEFTKVFNTNYEAGNLGSEQTFTAQIIQITPDLSQPAAIRNVLWQIDNSSGILEPQTYGTVSFSLMDANQCLTVPLSAMTDTSHSAVYIVNANDQLELREVKTGADDGKYIEITDGLNEGEVVVTGGMSGLKVGMKVNLTLEGEAQDGHK